MCASINTRKALNCEALSGTSPMEERYHKIYTVQQHLVCRVVPSLHINHMQMSIIEVSICRLLHMDTSIILICIWLICRLGTTLHTKCCGAVILTLRKALSTHRGAAQSTTRPKPCIRVKTHSTPLPCYGIRPNPCLCTLCVVCVNIDTCNVQLKHAQFVLLLVSN